MPALVNALFVLLAKENGPALARFADASGAQTHGTDMRLLCLDTIDEQWQLTAGLCRLDLMFVWHMQNNTFCVLYSRGTT